MRRFEFVATAVLLASLSVSGRAAADESEVAEQLFREGHALLKAQRYAEACPKFAESELHDPASGTLLALAYCQELGNALASAHASYLAAAELARTEHQDERQRAATERAQALSLRLSTLTVSLPEALWALPGLRVTNNGVELARTLWGRAVPSDGGQFAIQVSAANRKPWSTGVLLGAERDQRVVTVQALAEVDASPALPPVPAGLGVTQGRPPLTARADRHYWTTPRTIGWAAVGAGTVSGVVALYFTFTAKLAETDVQNLLRAEQSAPPSARIPWDASGHAREVDGQRARDFAQGFGVAAGALLVGGAALVIFGADSARAEAPSVALGIVPGAAQIQYAAAF